MNLGMKQKKSCNGLSYKLEDFINILDKMRGKNPAIKIIVKVSAFTVTLPI